MLEQHMVVPCTVYKAVQDQYADLRALNPVTTTCWFREISNFQHVSLRDENTAGPAMAWLRPNIALTAGDILSVRGSTYRITSVTAARRLGAADVQFQKCTLERFESFVS